MTPTGARVHADAYDQPRHTAELLADVPAAIERMTWDADRLRAHQTERLRTLLSRAIESSAFHRERLAGVDPSRITVSTLPDLPVMTKTEMMERFDDVVTDPRLTRSVVDDHVGTAPQGLTYLLDRYLVLASGGSSGTRGVFVYSAPAFTEFALSLLRGTLATLASFGVTPDEPIPGALLAAGATVHGTGAVGVLVGSAGAPVAMHRIPATTPFPVILDQLRAVRPLVLAGYPSVLRRVAAEQAAGRLDLQPLAISSTSEVLSAEARAEIEAAFGVPMTDAFGSSEGLCGVGPPGQPSIEFATDSCIVELVDHQLRPVAPGCVADKVLVTNLYNHTQPLIRYELTDRFIETPGPHADGRLRAVVDGRHDAPFAYGDVVLHPLAVRATLNQDRHVIEHQVRQTPDGIDVRLVAADGVELSAITDALTASLRAAGLPRPRVTVSAVDAIERDPTTGKARRFIPL
jgi:phenylacetate-coenzyme A ligase PaaK-like adenylate-forming protein